jgi:hypothetical protein
LAIELKAKGGRATSEQVEWLHLLSAEGWHATICVGFDAARDTISDYMRLPREQSAIAKHFKAELENLRSQRAATEGRIEFVGY